MKSINNIILIFLYFITLIFGVIALNHLYSFGLCNIDFIKIICIDKLEDKIVILSTIGVVLSAFIASFSVRLSIENSRKMEEEKQKENIEKLKSYLKLVLLQFKIVMIEISKDNVLVNLKHHYEEEKKTFENDLKLFSKKLQDKDFFSLLSKNIILELIELIQYIDSMCNSLNSKRSDHTFHPSFKERMLQKVEKIEFLLLNKIKDKNIIENNQKEFEKFLKKFNITNFHFSAFSAKVILKYKKDKQPLEGNIAIKIYYYNNNGIKYIKIPHSYTGDEEIDDYWLNETLNIRFFSSKIEFKNDKLFIDGFNLLNNKEYEMQISFIDDNQI